MLEAPKKMGFVRAYNASKSTAVLKLEVAVLTPVEMTELSDPSAPVKELLSEVRLDACAELKELNAVWNPLRESLRTVLKELIPPEREDLSSDAIPDKEVLRPPESVVTDERPVERLEMLPLAAIKESFRAVSESFNLPAPVFSPVTSLITVLSEEIFPARESRTEFKLVLSPETEEERLPTPVFNPAIDALVAVERASNPCSTLCRAVKI
jgi:hypothetical protein